MATNSKMGVTKRVVGEVAVIVVGVLIALGAESMYQRGIERSEVERYEEGLEADLRQDSLHLANDLLSSVGLPWQASSVDSLIQYLISDGEREAVDVLRHLRGAVILPSGAKARSTFDDMAGAGGLALFEQGQLRMGLVRYYSSYPRFVEESPYAGWLTSSYYPFIEELILVLGAERFYGMTRCNPSSEAEEFTTCLQSASQGDELQLLRTSDRLSQLVLTMELLRFFALQPSRQAQEDLLPLLDQLRGSGAAP